MSGNRLSSLMELYKKDPKDSFVKYGIALEYLALNDQKKAEDFFKLILEEDPNYIPAYMQLGLLKASQQKNAEAKKYYTKGIETAKKAGDKHAANEMENFLDELE